MNLPLDIYDVRPEAMNKYLAAYDWHFCKKACEEAVSRMRRTNPATDKKERIEPMTKEKVDELLAKYNIELEYNTLYDYVYTANQGLADLYKSSVPDEHHLALYVKNVIDDPDNKGGQVFRKWFSSECGNGRPVEWEDMM